MTHRLRIALPALSDLTPDTVVPFAILDRRYRITRKGRLAVRQMAQALRFDAVDALLHPDDAVVTTLMLPALPARRLNAAVLASIEPMALSDIDDLCIGHGPRQRDGSVTAAWVQRNALSAAWQLLAAHHLPVIRFVPTLPAQWPGDDNPERSTPPAADDHWQTPAPAWSLADPDCRPHRQATRWRRPLAWVALAALVWLVGLYLYTDRLRDEMRQLETTMQQAVTQAFPHIPVVLDPVKQARSERDKRLAGAGGSADTAFLPLARAAAETLGFTAGYVARLSYRDDTLTLTLAPGFTPPTDESALQQRAYAQGLRVEKSPDQPDTWIIRQRDPGAATGAGQ
ncbi:MAG: type II secretion system protein GspL [Burkholderiaceae bacterium]